MNLELLFRGLTARWRSLVAWNGALLGLTVSVLSLWPSLSTTDSLASVVDNLSPELVRALSLESLSSPAGYLNGNLFGLLLPLLIALLAISHAVALTAGDEDAGRLELLLALPLSRAGVYSSRLAATVVVLAATALLVGAVTWLGAVAVDMDLSGGVVIAAAASLFLFGLLHASLAVALAGLGLRGGAVQGVSVGALLTGYFVYVLFPLSGRLQGFSALSPWHWAFGGNPLQNGFAGVGAPLLVGWSLVLIAIGLVTVSRRTIRTA